MNPRKDRKWLLTKWVRKEWEICIILMKVEMLPCPSSLKTKWHLSISNSGSHDISLSSINVFFISSSNQGKYTKFRKNAQDFKNENKYLKVYKIWLKNIHWLIFTSQTKKENAHIGIMVFCFQRIRQCTFKEYVILY